MPVRSGGGPLRIAVAGGGYVGLVTAAGLASLGHRVNVVEVRRAWVNALQAGQLPISEPGLDELWSKVIGDELHVTAEGDKIYGASDLILVCVGTPSREDGTQDLSYIRAAVQEIGEVMSGSVVNPVVAIKSSVLPGTADEVVRPLLEKASGRRAGADFGLANVPEFLAEGTAVGDFLNPQRIVVGALDKPSAERVLAAHEGIGGRRIVTDLRTAEMIKYTSNAFLASRVSLSNEIGNMCKALSIDAYKVLEAVGMDDRIGPKFLRAGVGFGGSCFSKDVRALATQAGDLGLEARLLRAILEVNEGQPGRLVDLLERKLGSLRGRRIALLGLAFKPGTSDVRESRGLAVARLLLQVGARVVAYDPEAAPNARAEVPDLEYEGSAREALEGADGAVITTEWPEFSGLKEEFKSMKRPLVLDGRRALNPEGLGIEYEGLCW